MTFAEVLPRLAAGWKIRRKGCLGYYERDLGRSFALSDLLASDWELVEEPTCEADVCSKACGEYRADVRAAANSRLIRELKDMTSKHNDLRSQLRTLLNVTK